MKAYGFLCQPAAVIQPAYALMTLIDANGGLWQRVDWPKKLA